MIQVNDKDTNMTVKFYNAIRQTNPLCPAWHALNTARAYVNAGYKLGQVSEWGFFVITH